MLIKYTFGEPNLTFDSKYLVIRYGGETLKFTNISDFKIEGSKLSFYGDYIPKKYDIIRFKLKDNSNENLGRFIEFTHDRTGIKVDFSFDKQVQFPHIEPLCYSDVEIITYPIISDTVQYHRVWGSIGYIHDKETGIIRKDLWTPKEGDNYYFISDDLNIIQATYKSVHPSCCSHIEVFNCFKTEQEAETIRDKFLQLLSER